MPDFFPVLVVVTILLAASIGHLIDWYRERSPKKSLLAPIPLGTSLYSPMVGPNLYRRPG